MPDRPDSPASGLIVLLDGGALAQLGDADLLDRFEAATADPLGAERAFAAIVRRHGGMVLRVARARVETEADARDAFQATFALLALRSRSIRRRDALGAWLFGVASRVARRARHDAIRRRIRERQVAVAEADSAHDPARADLDGDLPPALRREVERLPSRHRAALILCDLEGLPIAEAARRLGCPPGTVKSWVSRGRARLRSRLIERGLIPVGWDPSPRPQPLVVPLALVRSTCHLARLAHLADIRTAPAVAARFLPLTRGVLPPMLSPTALIAWGLAAAATSVPLALSLTLVATPDGPSSPPPPARTHLDIQRQPAQNRLAAIDGHLGPDALAQQALRDALAAAEADPDMGRQPKLALRWSRLIQLARACTRHGLPVEARAALVKARANAGMDIPSSERSEGRDPVVGRVETPSERLALVAVALSRNGDRELAHETFDQAAAWAGRGPGVADPPGDWIKLLVAEVQVEGRPATVARRAQAERGLQRGVLGPEGQPRPVPARIARGRERAWILLQALGGDLLGAIRATDAEPKVQPVLSDTERADLALAVAQLVRADDADAVAACDAVQARILGLTDRASQIRPLGQLALIRSRLHQTEATRGLVALIRDRLVAPGLPVPELRSSAEALSGLADDALAAGRPDEARQLVSDASRILESSPPDDQDEWAGIMTGCLQTLAGLGDLAAVDRLLDRIPSDVDRAGELTEIVMLLWARDPGRGQGSQPFVDRWRAIIDRNLNPEIGLRSGPASVLGQWTGDRMTLLATTGQVAELRPLLDSLPPRDHHRLESLAACLAGSGFLAEANGLVARARIPALQHRIQVAIALNLPGTGAERDPDQGDLPPPR